MQETGSGTYPMDRSNGAPDDEPMDSNTESAESTSTQAPPSRRELVRPRTDRMAAGVAAGLGRYLDLSATLIRVGFVITSFFGGLGIALYLAGWLLIRSEDEAQSHAQRIFDDVRSGRSWIGLALLAVAALIVLDNLTFLPSSLVWATVLIVVGYLLYRGDIPDPSGGPDRSRVASPATPADASHTDTGSENEGRGVVPPPSPPDPRITPPPPPPTPPRPASRLGRLTIGVALVSLGVLAVVDNLTPVIDPRPRHYLALATVVIGLGLITGGWLGRARWMILLGFFIVPPLVASPLAEVEWDGDLERLIQPVSVDELQSSYEFAAGRAVFDLRNIDWGGQTADLAAEMAAGEIVLMVPDGVGVTGTASVDIGEVETPSVHRNGFGEIAVTVTEAGADGTVDADLHTGIGRVEVVVGSHTGTVDRSVVEVDARSASQLDDYDIGMGSIHLDLTDLELEDDADFDMEVGRGDIEIILPEDLNVAVYAASGAGTVSLPGSRSSGVGSSRTFERLDGPGPVLSLNLQVGNGDIVVTDRSS